MKKHRIIDMATNLNRLLKQRELSMVMAAKKAKMNSSSLHKYCNGVIPNNILSLHRLSEVLGVSLEELVYEQGEVKDSKREGGLSIEGTYEVTFVKKQKLD